MASVPGALPQCPRWGDPTLGQQPQQTAGVTASPGVSLASTAADPLPSRHRGHCSGRITKCLWGEGRAPSNRACHKELQGWAESSLQDPGVSALGDMALRRASRASLERERARASCSMQPATAGRSCLMLAALPRAGFAEEVWEVTLRYGKKKIPKQTEEAGDAAKRETRTSQPVRTAATQAFRPKLWPERCGKRLQLAPLPGPAPHAALGRYSPACFSAWRGKALHVKWGYKLPSAACLSLSAFKAASKLRE